METLSGDTSAQPDQDAAPQPSGTAALRARALERAAASQAASSDAVAKAAAALEDGVRRAAERAAPTIAAGTSSTGMDAKVPNPAAFDEFTPRDQ